MTIRELYHTFASHFNSKVFTAMLKSFLVVLSLPIIINLLVAVISLATIEQETTRFAENVLKKSEDELKRSYGEAFQLMNFVKSNDLVINYAKSDERNPWTEFQISKLLSDIAPFYTTIETAYIYFPNHNYVLSATVGGEGMYFSEYHYAVSYKEWKETMDVDWRGKREILRGKNNSNKNLVVSSVLGGERYLGRATIAVQLDSNTINQIFDNYKLNTLDQIVVFRENQLMFCTPNYKLTPEEEEALYYALDGDKINLLSDKYSIVKREQSGNGLQLFYLQNKSQKNSLLLFNKWFVVIAGGGYILVSFILSFFITKRNYTPIQKVFLLFQEEEAESQAEDYETMEYNIRNYIFKHNNMSRKLKQYENDLKEVYLEKLLHGKVVNEESIKEGAKLHNLQFVSGYNILIMYQIKEEEESVAEGNNMRELLYELSKEFFTSLHEFYLLEESSGYVALLNGEAESGEVFYQKVKAESIALQKYLDRAENIKMDICISKIFNNLNKLYTVYQDIYQQNQNQEESLLIKENELAKQCSMERILEIIKQDIEDSNLSTALVADKLNITQSYLSRYFKQQMGFGVLEYIHKYRINMAKTLMEENHNMRIKEVAEKTGFFNVSSFIRVFKKNEGITPGEFRDSVL